MGCTVGFYEVIKVQKTVNGVTSPVPGAGIVTESFSANTFAGRNAPQFLPQKGVLYQVMLNVYRTSDNSSLGYFSSGSSQVLVA